MTDDTNNTGFDLENDAVAMLEQKKQEIIATSGGVYAMKEAIASHTKHAEKVRGELQDMVTGGKIVPEVANFVLGFVSRSSTVLSDCLSSFKTRYDIKTGEALAYDNVVRVVKVKKNPPQPQPAAEEPTEVKSAAETIQVSPEPQLVEKKSKGKGKKPKVEAPKEPAPEPQPAKLRPDQRGRMGETVERLKTARKNKSNT
jgi:hypothetical protein